MSELLAEIVHPYVDHLDGGFACIESRVDHVVLTEGLADALLAITAAGLVPVLITRPEATIGYLARYHLAAAGGAWVLRAGRDHLVDPVSGASAATVESLLVTRAPAIPAPPGSGSPRFVVAVSTQAPADEATVLGGAAALLASRLAGTRLACWGAHEPATLAWDPAAYTAASRAWMPGPVRWMIADAAGRARFTTAVRRTSGGVEETATGILSAPSPSPAELAAAAVGALTALAESEAFPLFGTVALQNGRAALAYDASPVAPPEPLAAIVGPRAVRALAPDLDALARDFGARAVGRSRMPSLVVGFDRLRERPRDAAAAFAEALGTDQIVRLLARSGGER
jgi:hypothetical protein